jgi:GrpB-like predicted nucleotidyltransferase (UPF0157 family)
MSGSLGLESGTVRVVPYDPAWPALFAAEAARIRAALDGLPLRLEHMGSTGVPGLAAKPIVDILAGRPPGSAVGPYVEALARAGYAHRGEQGIPGREFFRRGDPRAYHVHLAEEGSAPWRTPLAFRDALRADPALAAEYGALKRELAARFPRDREAYIEGKGPFVARVLREAAEPGLG